MNYSNRFQRTLIITAYIISFMNSHISIGTCAFVPEQTVNPSSIVRQVLFPTDTCMVAARTGFITTYPIPVATCPGLRAPTDTVAPVSGYASKCLAYINGSSAQALALTDSINGLLHVYSFTNCTLGSELQTALSVPLIGDIAISSDSSLIAVTSPGPTLTTFTVNPTTCAVTRAASLNISSLSPYLGKIAFAPASAPCMFIIATANGGNPSGSTPPVLIPYNANGTFGTPTSLTVANGSGQSLSKAISFAPNGQWFAIGYLTENVVRIFKIAANCSISLIQTLTGFSYPNEIVYTPVTGCLVVIDGVTVKSFTLNPIFDGTVNTTPSLTSLSSLSTSLCFNSLTTGCGMAAISTYTGINTYTIA